MIGAKVKGKLNKEMGRITAVYPDQKADVVWDGKLTSERQF